MEQDKNFGSPQLPDALKSQLDASNCKYVYARFYSSEVNELISHNIQKIAFALRLNILLSYMNLSKGMAWKTDVGYYFYNGKWILQAEQTQKLMQGQYILILYPFYNENNRENIDYSKAHQAIDQFVGLAQSFFGPHVARDLHLSGVYFLEQNSLEQVSAGFHVYPNPAWELEDLSKINSNNIHNLDINLRVLELIQSSFLTSNRALSFVYLWSAIEISLGNGQERSKFCVEYIDSTSINNYLKILFDKRNSLLKDRFIIDFSFFDEYFLISLLKISMLRDKEVISVFTKQLEERIQVHNQ